MARTEYFFTYSNSNNLPLHWKSSITRTKLNYNTREFCPVHSIKQRKPKISHSIETLISPPPMIDHAIPISQQKLIIISDTETKI